VASADFVPVHSGGTTPESHGIPFYALRHLTVIKTMWRVPSINDGQRLSMGFFRIEGPDKKREKGDLRDFVQKLAG
jgi:hypothetical protein